MKTKTTYLAVTCIAALLVLAGCAPDRRQPANLVVAVDVSSPDEGRLGEYGAVLFRTQRSLPGGSSVTVSTFSGGVQVVYSGPPIASRGRFNEQIGEELLKSHKRDRAYGTRTEAALAQAARAVDSARAPTIVVVATDGGVEDQGPSVVQSIDESVSRLAASTNLRAIVVFGVLPQHRELWQRWLAPLGDRALVRGINDVDGALGVCLTGRDSEGQS
jgi:hypothetical protein